MQKAQVAVVERGQLCFRTGAESAGGCCRVGSCASGQVQKAQVAAVERAGVLQDRCKKQVAAVERGQVCFRTQAISS